MKAPLALLAVALLVGPQARAGDETPAEEQPEPSPSPPEIRDGVPMQVEVLGGQRFDGAFVGIEDDTLELSMRDGPADLPLPIVVSVEIGGVVYPRDSFLEGVRIWSQELRDRALRTPPPVLVGASCVLWAGAGPALLGDWDGFLAYTVLEASFIGAGAIMVADGQFGPLLPLATIDLLLHAWAGVDSVRESRRRRRRMKFSTSLAVGTHGGDLPVLGVTVGYGSWDGGAAVSGAGQGTSGECGSGGLTGHCSFPY
jgi:hypothetical protein